MKMTGASGLRSVFQPKNASVVLSVVVVIWQAQLMWPQTETLQKDQVQEAQPQAQLAQKTVAQEPPAVAVVRLPEPPPPPVSVSKQAPTTEPVVPGQIKTPKAIQQQPKLDVQAPAPMQPRTLDKGDPVSAYTPLRPIVMVESSTPTLLSRPVPETEVAPPKVQVVQVAMNQPIRDTTKDTPSQSEAVHVSASDVKSGRTWLRILEHGQGPEIEISWPTGARGATLFAKMVRCYGLTLALHTPDGRLYADTGRQGASWDLNLDLYSGFMRQVGTWHAPAERRAIQEIHARHRGLRGTPVRLFPRRVDARLLAGLGQIIGEGYAKVSSIRAHYILRGGRLFVENIYVDGEAIAGKIDLSPSAKCVRGGEI